MALPTPSLPIEADLSKADAAVASNIDLERETEIDVGIMQRFGETQAEQVELQATPGQMLTLTFAGNDGPITLQTDRVVLHADRQELPESQLQERLVLGTFRSFESAEAQAELWQSQGIPVELAQPDTWQVWADRQVYTTPLLRRLLQAQLQQQGLTGIYLATDIVKQSSRIYWSVNGYKYHRDRLTVTASDAQIQVDGVLYPGSLQLQPNAYGTYTLVNVVDVEDYLRGVVPYEIGPSAPQAAVEAQAVLARTYALRNLRRFAIDDYQLCADTQCQVYRGLERPSQRADRAIRATEGLVLTHAGELIDAVYSSTTGGVTAAFNDVWDGFTRPYLQPVVDTDQPIWDLTQKPLSSEANLRDFLKLESGFNEKGWRYFRWRVESSLTSLNADLREYLQSKQHPLAGFKTITSMQVEQRSPGGRVQQMTVGTDLGSVPLQKDESLRAFLAPNSTLFYLERLQAPQTAGLKGYAFVGGGLGHGVGLSQTGSYHLAEQGWSSADILEFYYPNTRLEPLHADLIFWQAKREGHSEQHN
ncbi:MAG: SpoIID/LytB domain-containing protein [Cyanobacteria bacterium P01_H01_bin.121]